jgi:hypothetical protein
MAFRADEAAATAFQRAKAYLIGTTVPQEDRRRCEDALLNIVDMCGPAVDGYPAWHPLVSNHDSRNPEFFPTDRCGYNGLDHTIIFAHGFVTCPYGKTEEILSSVANLSHHCADITAEELDVPFYNTGATAVLVRCHWHSALSLGHYVPKRLAVPLMLEMEVPTWRWSELAERWETMRPYLLGTPHGSRSSLFVDQDTAMAMKKIHNAMNESGMFGPLQMG